ncbi:hypothetical protein Lser_V15G05512 [Lactuca serriola]
MGGSTFTLPSDVSMESLQLPRSKAETWWLVALRRGVPSLLAFPHGCQSSDCIVRYTREFGVEEAPAIVILRDPGVKHVVYHGSINNSRLIDIMEQNKHQCA